MSKITGVSAEVNIDPLLYTLTSYIKKNVM